ncbi:MAG TPA: polysaccharide deacetylase family protein [Gemmatimonadales bacterium]|jgi:peptidoglycan/xylan/chitin deacetylase (PgdA/CDA1 family)|nr:polysaccharide deacetylase family protein [Gemmatimonadales bacterium]
MRIPGGKTARRSGQWLLGKVVQHAVILGYHRVIDGPDPYRLGVSPERFAEQLAVLAGTTHPLPLEKLPELLASGRLPKRTVAVTFDDGYADVLHHAKPLLARFGIPATMFVISGALGREPWWDRLEGLASAAAARGCRFTLPIGDSAFKWPVKGVTSSKEGLCRALYPKLRALSSGAREVVLDQLVQLVGVPPETHDGLQRIVTADELRRLADGDLVQIGAHTVSHPALSGLSAERQRAEIAGSRRDLQAVLERPVTGFSYPFGDTGAGAETIVQEEGFHYACESRNAVAWRRTHQFALPRFWVPNWDGQRFAHWLERWLDD